jgi:hypothetical protein
LADWESLQNRVGRIRWGRNNLQVLKGLIPGGIHHKVGERAADINANPDPVLIVLRHPYRYIS